jgi:hypothetical protein
VKISVRTATIALVLAASAAGVALAQNPSSPAGPSPAPAASSSAPADSAADPSATAQGPQGPAASSQSPAGDPAVQHVTNGPVPDTPASRAANGGPMSNGGQATAPAGN